jgi:hypothetical protein
MSSFTCQTCAKELEFDVKTCGICFKCCKYICVETCSHFAHVTVHQYALVRGLMVQGEENRTVGIRVCSTVCGAAVQRDFANQSNVTTSSSS